MKSSKPEGPYRPAVPWEPPHSRLIQYIEGRLAEQAPDALAYTRVITEGDVVRGIEVHLTIAHAALVPLVHALAIEFQESAPAEMRSLAVTVMVDAQHSWRLLYALQQEVLAQSDELKARGIHWTTLGVNVWINRLDIGVKDLTEEHKSYLEQQFGADRVHIFASAGWYGYAPLPPSGNPSTKP